MLIFTRARAFKDHLKGTKSNIAKYLLTLFIISALSACEDRKDSIDQVDDSIDQGESSNDQAVSSQPASDVTNSLLADGFYTEQADPAGDIGQSQDGPTQTAKRPETEVSDATSVENELTSETQSKDSNNEILDSKSLIEGLGFSEALQDQETSNNTEQATPFCLNTENTPQSQESIKEACQKISKRLASVKYAACEAAQLQLTGCASVKGFPILMSEFSPTEERKPQGRILIVGGTHGDELTSVSVIIRWIEKLNRHHSGLFHWHLVPMMNPDGVLKSGATRTNGNGVDLNRNMPSDDWERNAIKYWVEKGGKDPRKYPGEAASSEPETQWLIDEIESFKPDAIISVHAPYGVVDFDSLLLNTAPKSLGKLRLNLLGTYPGSLGNYAGINLNIPVITLELPHSWVMPSEIETTKIWEDIVTWLKKNINTDVAKNETQP